jgi:hypothetical protein
MVEARRADEGINVLMERIRGSFARILPWLTAACYVRAVLSSESPGGVSPPGALRSVREPLDSYGSHRPVVRGQGLVSFQWAKRPGYSLAWLPRASRARIHRPRNRLYLCTSHRTR